MNKYQLQHLAKITDTVAFAQFAAFGVAAFAYSKTGSIDWMQIAIAFIIFVKLEVATILILRTVKEKGDAGAPDG